MRKFSYRTLAWDNIRKNRQTYFPYMLTCICSIAMYYIMHSLSRNPGAGDGTLAGLLRMGNFVIGLFSVLFLFYTNSFLMKRRKKEFGLFNILGMDRGNIGKILSWETIFVYVLGMVLGLGFGILLSKFVYLILYNMMRFDIQFNFEISWESVQSTFILFTSIFLLLLLYSLRQIYKVNPIELLHGGEVGEREPKAKWFLAIVGLICLITGYSLSIFVVEPVVVLLLFFIEVILVIIGTYLLFTVGSIALLKLMRKNKAYYYEPKHFISVSGMIYRMKQNATGLATICILSTMVLVMLSSTASLYFGMEDSVKNRYPYQIHINATKDSDELRAFIESENQRILGAHNLERKEMLAYRFLPVASEKRGNEYFMRKGASDSFNLTVLNFISLEDFKKFSSYTGSLDQGEVLIYGKEKDFEDKSLRFEGQDYQVVKSDVSDFPMLNLGEAYNSDTMAVYYVILPDTKALENIAALKPYAMNGKPLSVQYQMSYNIEADDDTILQAYQELKESIYATDMFEGSIKSRVASRGEFLQLYGGLFFLGIFLGLVFVMATVLIIYYKQISEGFDDQQRFAIMKKVGLSPKEAKKTVDAQISSMFFIPLLVAGLHLAFAFPSLTKMLKLINQTNTPLFVCTTLISLLAFGFIYALVYKQTAKIYFGIVNRKA